MILNLQTQPLWASWFCSVSKVDMYIYLRLFHNLWLLCDVCMTELKHKWIEDAELHRGDSAGNWSNRRAQQFHCELDSPSEDLLNRKSVKPMQKWTPTPQSLSFETCRALLSDFATNNELMNKRPFEQAGLICKFSTAWLWSNGGERKEFGEWKSSMKGEVAEQTHRHNFLILDTRPPICNKHTRKQYHH